MKNITLFILVGLIPAALLAASTIVDAGVLCAAAFVTGLIGWTVAQYSRKFELRPLERPIRFPVPDGRGTTRPSRDAEERLAA